jgi:hypothetical protein
MADTGEIPFPARPDPSRPGGDSVAAAASGVRASRSVRTAVVVFTVLVAGSALAGLLAGFIWTVVAPHAQVITTGGGGADVVNPETSAFIAADGWFAALCALGGAACGLLGWVFAVRRHGVPAVLGLLGGGVAAALAARWLGQHSGQAAFNHLLAVSRPGTLLRAPLALGAHGALAFWPLAAGAVAGGIEAIGLLRGRRYGAADLAGPAKASAEGAMRDPAEGW